MGNAAAPEPVIRHKATGRESRSIFGALSAGWQESISFTVALPAIISRRELAWGPKYAIRAPTAAGDVALLSGERLLHTTCLPLFACNSYGLASLCLHAIH